MYGFGLEYQAALVSDVVDFLVLRILLLELDQGVSDHDMVVLHLHCSLYQPLSPTFVPKAADVY